METNLKYRYYYIINKDLNMSPGKIASQVSHVAMMLADRYKTIGTAIVVQATEEKMKELLGLMELMPNTKYYTQYDIGKTEVKKGSLTCIGIKVYNSVILKARFKKLELVK